MPHTEPHSPRQTSQPSGHKDRLSAAPDTLFVYGSLQFPEVLFALIDRVPAHSPAQARGWRVANLPGRVYPGLISGTTTAAGYLLTDLTPGEWRVLDAFEDPVYDLRRLDLVDGRHGWSYTCTLGAEVLDTNWSAEAFARDHLPDYIERCTAWRHRHEAKEQAS